MTVENNASFSVKLKSKLLELLKLSNRPAVRVYSGYGTAGNCFLFGHALSLSPLPRKKYRQNIFINAISMLRLFMVKPLAGAQVKLEWDGTTHTAKTEIDGFFRFEWTSLKPLLPGWHSVKVELTDPRSGNIMAFGNGNIFVPFKNQYAFISDIDDTFLISHSSKLRKRLFALLTKNAHSRTPFAGVVNHYQLLSLAHAPDKTTNPFFYVSSSEWNLYNYIQTFSSRNGLPDGVYLLSQMKKFKEVFKTGQNKHATKFMRIARVLEAYPGHRFILLGDDAQEDPTIYASVVAHYKNKIFAVYIRQVEKKNREAATSKIKEIEQSGVACCYFAHSSEAVVHSKAIGLIV
ncbi:MAG: DUF2183 domain-containing protein [Chitinophagaceae bacterium]|nr:DUF2183 domain-containing protein [Chitinophagaceae bacterium]